MLYWRAFLSTAVHTTYALLPANKMHYILSHMQSVT